MTHRVVGDLKVQGDLLVADDLYVDDHAKVSGSLQVDGNFYLGSEQVVGLVEQIDFIVSDPATDDNYILMLHATYPFDIKQAYLKLGVGSANVDFYLSGRQIGGLHGLAVTTTKSTETPSSDYSVVLGDDLTCYVNSASSAEDLACSIKTERT